ncbi:uncharacterized protein LOC144922178 [Branchiostoma floridae x Branchiostoma belcheri]
MAPENGAQSSEGPYFFGDQVTYSCDQGYELAPGGASSVTCQADETWSADVPTCQRVECPYRMAPENGAQSSEGPYYYEDVVTYTCDEGYGLNGASSVTCQVDETWTDGVPTCQRCPSEPSLPTDRVFDYADATSAITGSTLDPAVAEEVGLDSFLNDLAAYAEYDGTPVADLPDTDNIIIMPERWALTYTDPETGIRTGMFLPETKNFDPEVGLPDELPSVVITALRETYPLYYAQYLSNMEANYRTSRATMEFDCPNPVRTDLGGGFALEPIAPSLCRPVDRIEESDTETGRTVKIVISGEIIVQPLTADGLPGQDEFAFEVDLESCDCSTEPPSNPPCTVVMCNSAAPFNNGDTCTYMCSGECSGASTTVTCIDGFWNGEVAVCETSALLYRFDPHMLDTPKAHVESFKKKLVPFALYSFTKATICDDGYFWNEVDCVDIDECADSTDNCHADATCTNTDGSFTCTCNNGYAGDGVTCISCPPALPLPIVFDYEAARTAIVHSTLDPVVAEEIGLDSFLNELTAYAEYDGTPLADLPDTDNIIIMPERWTLTYTDPQTEGITMALFLPETTNFDPDVGLPDELPSYAIETFSQTYPLYYQQYLSSMEVDYRNSRTTIEFDIATYGPDADCPYPPRTDLGGGFALERIPPFLCYPDERIEVRDPSTEHLKEVVIGRDLLMRQEGLGDIVTPDIHVKGK